MPAETTARPKAWYDEINLGKAAQPDSFPSPAEADGAGADSDLVFETVQNLRTQRLLMVQTYAQLAFCYEALVQRCLI